MMSGILRSDRTILQPLRRFSKEQRISQAQALVRLFDLWHLTTQEQTRLLGFRDDSRATLARYRKGAPLDNNPDTLERAANLFAIHGNLMQLYPANQQLAFAWITTPNGAFNERTPLELMCNEGLAGIQRVRYHLDDRLIE